ncbi:YraN family protein [Paraglaciecola aestuariivivens]
MTWIKQALSSVIGNRAEQQARQFLTQQGLDFVCQNYRCKSGEVDLIMRDKQELVFVEVKYRSKSQHGQAIEFFHLHKRRKFESAVMHYLQEQQLNPSVVPHRIDLIGIDGQGQQADITWLKSV